ncbi:hypothetical protein JNB11_02230 [Kocuria palustris]|nr:hypothetical protein [Kocuria palustris]
MSIPTVVVSRGSHSLVKNRIVELNEHHSSEVLVNLDTVYLTLFNDLMSWARQRNLRHINNKIIFMFFDGVNSVLDFIGELLDYQRDCSTPVLLKQVYLYFDSSVTQTVNSGDPYSFLRLEASTEFSILATVTLDVLRHLSCMVDRVCGVYFDDFTSTGSREQWLQALMRNHPKLERINLSLFQLLVMRGFV